MAMDDIRLETDQRQRAQYSLGEESILLNILIDVSVRLRPGKVVFIINEIKRHSADRHLQDAYILAPPGKVHVEVRQIFHLIFPLLAHAKIRRQDHSDIILLFIKASRQRSHHIRKSAGLDKGDSLRCGK